jgi:phosphatidylinositol dimannoside acyltransferase
MLLRIGLELADWLLIALPAPAAYAVADLAGRAWYRFAPGRRRLVEANLRRVCAATGRPTRGRAWRQLVRAAFVNHARYYLELMRAPHFKPDQLEKIVVADDWERWDPVFRAGAVVASAHLGNFEPYGSFLAALGLRAVAPVEEIHPPELFEFLRSRRGASASGIEIIPIAHSRRRLMQAARDGMVVGLIADRDLDGDGVPVTLFGSPTTLPAGPAFLALSAGRPLLVARCLRLGRERFHGRVWEIARPDGLDRRSAMRAMTAEMGARFEEAIAEAPEQWWGAFQPIWPDLRS